MESKNLTIENKMVMEENDSDSDIEDSSGLIITTIKKFDLYNNPEYITANIEAEEFENSEIANYYKKCFCLKECGDYKIREDTLQKHYKNIEPFVYNSFEEVKNRRKKHLCVLGKNHTGKCCDRPVLFKKNIITDKLIKSIDGCIYQSPGNDDYVYKNRASRLHPIHIPKSIERQIRNKNTKLKCAIPLCEYSTPFMLATAYIDWLCYIVNIHDIGPLLLTELKEQNSNFISILKNQHKTFVSDYFTKFNRKVFDENQNSICVIAKNIILTKHVSDPLRDNRIIIEPEDIQMGHIKSRNDAYFSVRGTNIVMMSRYGNRVIGEDSFIENIWIDKLKNVISHY
jgi:hypothetical protein